jgi:hypothetical protein
MRFWVEGEDANVAGPFVLTVEEPETAGIVSIPFGPAQLSGLTARGPRYWYDIQITNGATVLEGRLFVEPDRVR